MEIGMILITLSVASIGWYFADKLKLSAPAMLGSMIAVGVTNIFLDYAYLPTSIKIFTQAISGAFIGMQIAKKDIMNFRYLVKPFIFLIALLTINTFVMGILINKICGLDLTTALLSCVAGGVTDISLIAMDMNADAGTVALMQTSRLVFVLLFFSTWIKFMTKNKSETVVDLRMQQNNVVNQTVIDRLIKTKFQRIIFTIITSFAMGYVGYISKIPAATMVFPMFLIVFLNCTTCICFVPTQAKNIAQLLAGALVGTSICSSTFSNLNKTLIPIVLLLISYWFINLIYGIVCEKYKLLDLKSAMFASAPGGATDMALIAADLNADLTKIALIQVLRAAYVVAVMPFLIIIFVKLFS
ncbi:AbrB family transcriptional regulator [Anaerorhabdus sp.]|uniref:AbrB family transcriptional regulator n=1 Tax=Anaerorhabdus sp. TaxID=1872524 RepID=UPI002B21255D|nr:AbrB family transcriptional regulator [Anaerorhabdus sp.]MEA4875923.1 AbrB family transcriptional regulator [Anaerorhabdus sp.]